MVGAPRFQPRADAPLKIGDDFRGDAGIDIGVRRGGAGHGSTLPLENGEKGRFAVTVGGVPLGHRPTVFLHRLPGAGHGRELFAPFQNQLPSQNPLAVDVDEFRLAHVLLRCTQRCAAPLPVGETGGSKGKGGGWRGGSPTPQGRRKAPSWQAARGRKMGRRRPPAQRTLARARGGAPEQRADDQPGRPRAPAAAAQRAARTSDRHPPGPRQRSKGGSESAGKPARIERGPDKGRAQPAALRGRQLMRKDLVPCQSPLPLPWQHVTLPRDEAKGARLPVTRTTGHTRTRDDGNAPLNISETKRPSGA